VTETAEALASVIGDEQFSQLPDGSNVCNISSDQIKELAGGQDTGSAALTLTLSKDGVMDITFTSYKSGQALEFSMNCKGQSFAMELKAVCGTALVTLECDSSQTEANLSASVFIPGVITADISSRAVAEACTEEVPSAPPEGAEVVDILDVLANMLISGTDTTEQ
ncbi:MAG: hypothetical protein IJG63_00265, partial [Oscillospiraceae bacterium]|nr:hypothetical protein [Oscillospiraceae bacterium]